MVHTTDTVSNNKHRTKRRKQDKYLDVRSQS